MEKTTTNRPIQIKTLLKENKVKDFQIKYVLDAVFKRGILDFEKITTIPKEIRSLLKENIVPFSLTTVSRLKGQQTEKVLFKTVDGNPVESVLMRYLKKRESRYSLCVSVQSGCAMGCQFCATGKMGFIKNLTVDEIVDQMLYFKNLGKEVDTISFMGMGEPFLNLENVLKSIDILTDPDLVGLSPKRINVSTVGIIPGIKALTKTHPRVNLAFSLHSPLNPQRRSLMPVSKIHAIEDVFVALDEHIWKTHKKVFISYILLNGVNNSDQHAKTLVQLIKNRGKYAYLYHVNLIRCHQTGGSFEAPSPQSVASFMNVLTVNGIACSLRKSFGEDIGAACGQLGLAAKA
ncbi:MAG: radical SAM protein [Patescibacteria group bacterium]|nr:radical SAM protein [Patescibacteria group bacterium]